MGRYLKMWLVLSSYSFQTFFASRIGAILFLFGKVLRVIFFLLFLGLIFSQTKALAGYNFSQVILFYLTFNLIDATTQMLFREVYRFRQQIVSGDFDLILVKPVNVLFRVLFGWTDFLDLLTLIPLILAVIYTLLRIGMFNLLTITLYLLLIFNSLLIASAFHICILALAILTTEIDHSLMIYRDVTGMGKFPIKIYEEPLRSLLTFVIPVGIMMSYPAEILFSEFTFGKLFYAFFLSLVILGVSLLLWRYALRRYTSASS